MRLLPTAIAAALPFLACCPGSKGVPQPDNFPSGDEFVAQLVAKQDAAKSFKALGNRMDYRVDDERIKTDVHVMGERGAKIRMNALNPDDTTAADLGCDGISFTFVHFNKNCQMSGPCTSDSIAQLLRVSLAPDDFMSLAIGSAPLLGDATANAKWNGKNGTVELELLAKDNQFVQKIILDGKDARYDVLKATMQDAKGELEWELENRDFGETKDVAGNVFRVPGKSRFQQPKAKGDLKVRWEKRELNLELPPQSYVVEPPMGLPECGATTPAPAPAGP